MRSEDDERSSTPEASYPHRAPLDSMFRFALLAALFALSRADSQEPMAGPVVVKKRFDSRMQLVTGS